VRILHLEDNPTDAELVRELLRGEWADCTIEVVSTRPAFLAALKAGGHPVIISDFTLVNFTGPEALELSRELRPDAPFIYFTGTPGEDRAVDAVHNGASDYVLKDHPKRLVTAVKRGLRESRGRRSRRAAETALRQSEARLRIMIEHQPGSIQVIAPNGRLLELNQSGLRVLGATSVEQACRRPFVDYLAPEYRAEFVALHERVMRGETLTLEFDLLALDGVRRRLLTQAVPLRDETGRVTSCFGVSDDVTGRRQNEALIHGQKRVLEMIATGQPLGETLTALVSFIEHQSPGMLCSILLLDSSGRCLFHGAAPSLPPAFTAAIDGQAIGPDLGSCGTAAFHRKTVVVEDIATDPLWDKFRSLALPHGLRACWSTPIFDAQRRVLGTFAIYYPTPARPSAAHLHLIEIATQTAAICINHHRAERRLRELVELLDRAPHAILVSDLGGLITFWNRGAERIFGLAAADALGRRVEDLFGAEPRAKIAAAQEILVTKGEWSGEFPLQGRDGHPVIVEFSATVIRDDHGRPQARLAIVTDISERRRLEERFLRAQRLESVGMLASGIAHDLNNVLSPILMGAPMHREHLTEAGDLKLLAMCERSAERGAALVRQILSFAQGVGGEARPIQVKHLLRELGSVIDETFPKNIRYEPLIAPNLWTVTAHPTQIHQVLLNLCVNARDAMPAGGRLTLRAENTVLDEVSARAVDGGRPGAWLMLQVQDTGVGIAPEVLPRIWEPFFTTKASGKGTGLGLSTVRGIVENHRGFATVHSEVGRGTSVRVYLPADEDALGEAVPPATLAIQRGHGELVLLVDDEVNIRNITTSTLSRHGYRVIAARDGTEALALFTPRTQEISLLITDLNMPRLDGAAIASVVRRMNPAVKILAASGLGSGSEPGAPRPAFADAFLSKPFNVATLLQAVHDLLHPLETAAPKS
jgi:PAS domain S-box-containing protein